MGGKKESYKQNLTSLFDSFLETDSKDEIADYLVSHSNLPSPRGNARAYVASTKELRRTHTKQ